CKCLRSLSCHTLLYWKLLFFFQAEDGIRDRNVTGVQTCALPISAPTPSRASTSTVISSIRPGRVSTSWKCGLRTVNSKSTDSTRSEERRVGKECKARRSGYNE